MFSGNGWAIPQGLEERRSRLQVHEGDARRSTRGWPSRRAVRPAQARRAGPSPASTPRTRQADVKIYEDIYQPMGNKQFDDAVTLLVRPPRYGFAHPALAGERRVPAGVDRRGEPRARGPADAAPGARPGAEGSAGRDRQGEVTHAPLGERRRQQHDSAGPLAGPALAVRLPRARDLDRLPLHPPVDPRLPRC